ncbi:probable protein phosphatase CG10417 [Diorhabda sublineata]|uniref:probable protein phosphatase CG10417 n=1 Tax=Diorhabda sublineata TaxID=1163346 RepID=UPI0024E17056|nr:probable protein phosphatase CG10417 [Diorhabda sublineata]
MGSYLSEPVTEKISTDEANDKLNCGASSMQGWRVTQEDAHNNILDFDTNTSFFAVYDGHGGHEVAQYCSQKLPQFIKDTQAYKDGDIERALIDGFLGFDATIATPEVIQILKEIVGEREAEEASDEEENVDNLYKEATMPIEQVIEKYTNLVTPGLKNLKKDAEKFPKSPYLKSKQDDGCSASSSNSNLPQPGSSQAESSSISDSSEAKPSVETKETSLLEKNGTVMDVKVSSTYNTESKEVTTSSGKEENDDIVTPIQNGETTEIGIKIDVTSPSPQENGDIDKKGKGKAIKSPIKKNLSTRPKRNANQLYKTLLNFEDEESDSEDEEDKTFVGPNDDSSEDDDEGVNTAIEVEGSDEEGTSSEGGDEAEEEEEEDEGDEDQDEDLEFTKNMKEEPGSDSGCTAVVALLKGNELYVANAGDSRCIVCRNGKAIDMSFDHKPEDAPERERIVKAGGRVTADGRVNGGLNLSRAIGDHAYKQSKELSDKEQMITALPDIKTLTINPGEDEFFVLACDGIWNFMSSQEVVDFVRPMILENKKKLSTVCEEMFDHCLAPNTLGDGTGCDNMTAIIVQFKTNIMKRSASPRADNDNSKRAKTEETVRSDTATTA